MLTPSWKSAAWNRKPQARSAGQDVERSPDLRPGSDAVPADSEWEQAETQADREWYAPKTLLMVPIRAYNS